MGPVQAQMIGPVALVPVSQALSSIFPAPTGCAAVQGSICVYELMTRIGLPVGRFATTRDDHTWPIGRASAFGLDGGRQVHQGSDWAEYALPMIDQAHQFAQVRLAS